MSPSAATATTIRRRRNGWFVRMFETPCFSFFEKGQQIARNNRSAILNFDFSKDSGRRCRHFEYDLVCFKINEVFIARNGIAWLFVPGHQGRISD